MDATLPSDAELLALLSKPPEPALEKNAFDSFLFRHAQRYDFSSSTSAPFGEIFRKLIEERFLPSPSWEPPQPRDYQLRVLQCMRVLMRDPVHRNLFADLGGAEVLVRLFADLSCEHCAASSHAAEFGTEMLVETLSILKRFATLECLCPGEPPPHRRVAAAAAAAATAASQPSASMAATASASSAPYGAAGELQLQRGLVALLSTSDAIVLQCALVCIQQLVQLEPHLVAIGQLGCAELLLRILTEYEAAFKALTAELIEQLLRERTFLKDVLLHDGTSAILSALHSHDPGVQIPLLRSLERLSTPAEPLSQVADGAAASARAEIRQLGGINVLLALLSAGRCSHSVAGAICSVLTALALDDEAALQIRQANGVYLIGRLLLLLHPEATAAAVSTMGCGGGETAGGAGGAGSHGNTSAGGGAAADEAIAAHEGLATIAFRALRYIFSTERNRQIFRRLFPPDLFASFIDVGHYASDLSRYAPLARQMLRLSSAALSRMLEALQDINIGKDAPGRKRIRDYLVQELLGKGAFGSVYQVKKDTGETLFAMKELPLEALGGGSGGSGGGGGGGDGGGGGSDGEGVEEPTAAVKREVQILSTLQHPNIISYYESFKHKHNLYIVMELVEGATLLDHLNSLTEKGGCMAESRIWAIFTQICLALRYVHKEKKVVHRDLTPSNIMISADGVVKLADFGLARQRSDAHTASVMDSVVGTVLYQCPEIIQAETYGEKADVWALGCILYQMATLRPPFEGGNPLVVANAIVDGRYKPLDAEAYPPQSLLAEVVRRLLTVEPETRPDIDEVATLISPVLLTELGRVSKEVHTLRKDVQTEREWRVRHEREAKSNKEAVHRLFARHQACGAGQQQPAARQQPPGGGGAAVGAAAGGCAPGSMAIAGGGGGAPAAGSRPSLQREALEPSPMRRSVASVSRTPMLSISPSRIREIHDPCSLILMQLHKILFISQLPPSLEGDGQAAERQAIDKYKRELFSHKNLYRGRNLKDELHKLMNGSHEMIDIAFRSHASLADGDVPGPNGSGFDANGSFSQKQTRISYEDLQRAIEHVLESTGYYDVKGDAEQGPPAEPPLGGTLPLNRPPIAPPSSLNEPPGISRASSLPAPPPPLRIGNGLSTPRGAVALGVLGPSPLGPSPLGSGPRELPPVHGRGSRGNLAAAALPPDMAPASHRELPHAS